MAGRRNRAEDVEVLLDRARAWASTRPDIHALALVGSWARDEAGEDSDVDLVLLVDSPAAYLGGEDWPSELGASSTVRIESWGALTERRLALRSGLEVDVGIALPSWAATAPVEAGTARVVADGLRILYDPDGLLARLRVAVVGD